LNEFSHPLRRVDGHLKRFKKELQSIREKLEIILFKKDKKTSHVNLQRDEKITRGEKKLEFAHL
jgi:hypothetical protein